MASAFSITGLLSTSTPSSPTLPLKQQTQSPSPFKPHSTTLTKTLTSTAAAAAILLSTLTPTPPSLAASSPPPDYTTYYGLAAGAASYGGYGGNASKRDQAEYIYDVPAGWKERLVSKVEKGTNGTDSEFFNPKKRTEKEYLTFLYGFRALAPKDIILNNLALSDVDLQDLIASAEGVTSQERKDESGQMYYDYEIDGVVAHSLISVTCAKNKLYAHFVNAPALEWKRDQDMLRHLHHSFKTLDY